MPWGRPSNRRIYSALQLLLACSVAADQATSSISLWWRDVLQTKISKYLLLWCSSQIFILYKRKTSMIPSRHLHLIKLKYGRYNMHLKEEVEVVGMGKKKGGGGAILFSRVHMRNWKCSEGLLRLREKRKLILNRTESHLLLWPSTTDPITHTATFNLKDFPVRSKISVASNSLWSDFCVKSMGQTSCWNPNVFLSAQSTALPQQYLKSTSAPGFNSEQN